MSRLDWDHNAYYHRLLLRQLPFPCARVADIGCGAGTFAAKLARRAAHVDALDRSPAMVQTARRATPGNVSCILGDVLQDGLSSSKDRTAGQYDAVLSISAVHHMRLQEALPTLAALLRPGGVLAVVSLPRVDLPREIPVELAAAAGHRLLGAFFAAARYAGRGDWFAHEPTHDAMPVVLDPTLTTRAVRREAAAVLPGAQVRRLLFWRYLLLWRRPERTEPQDPVATAR